MNPKKQRGMRLDPDLMGKVDEYCVKMDTSYNYVVQQCVAMFFPVMESPEYYAARMKGITPEKFKELVREAFKKYAQD